MKSTELGATHQGLCSNWTVFPCSVLDKTHLSMMHEKGGSEPVTAVFRNLEGRDVVILGIFLYSLCSLQLHALVFSLWTGINQRARPGPPVVVDKQLAAIRACSTESLSGGCLGDNGTLLVLIAPLKLNKELDPPFSVFPSASKLPETVAFKRCLHWCAEVNLQAQKALSTEATNSAGALVSCPGGKIVEVFTCLNSGRGWL